MNILLRTFITFLLIYYLMLNLFYPIFQLTAKLIITTADARMEIKKMEANSIRPLIPLPKMTLLKLLQIDDDVTTFDGRRCQFPFIINSKVYYTCTDHGSEFGEMWCSTKFVYDQLQSKALCKDKKNSENDVYNYYKRQFAAYLRRFTERKNSKWNFNMNKQRTVKGLFCKFPFIYGNRLHDSCLKLGKNDSRTWCSLTSNFDFNESFDFCSE